MADIERVHEKNINDQEYWDKIYTSELRRGKIRKNRKLFNLVFQNVVGSTILDVGCGSGALVDELYRKGLYKAIGVDISKYAIHFANTHSCTKACGKFKVMDVSKGIKLKTSSVDTVICLQVLEHLNDPKLVIEEMKRVAKKRIIVSVPLEDKIKHKEHVWHFTTAGLIDLIGEAEVVLVGNRLFAFADVDKEG
jgi:2-polyprenyl-3-methyl-5-hydroxy-6-metoxy-1,4-benzoquinol methylase